MSQLSCAPETAASGAATATATSLSSSICASLPAPQERFECKSTKILKHVFIGHTAIANSKHYSIASKIPAPHLIFFHTNLMNLMFLR